MKLFLVEDDDTIRDILAEELTGWGYDIYAVNDFSDVLHEFSEQSPALVLMDIMLPTYNGYYWCQKIREVSQVPIIFISSRSEDMDMIQAISFGADDYITKPFHVEIVRAKIQALLRRTYDFTEESEKVSLGKFVLKVRESILLVDNETVELTKTELSIMEMLIKAGGKIVGREKLMEHLWQGDQFIDDNTLAVNMTRLRKKLTAAGAEGHLCTKRGVGYYMKEES